MTETTSTVGTTYIGKHNTFFVSPRSATYKGRDYEIEFSFHSEYDIEDNIDTLRVCVMLNDGFQPRYLRSLKELKDLVVQRTFDSFGTPPDMEFIKKTLNDMYRHICRIDKIEPNETVLKALKFEGDVI